MASAQPALEDRTVLNVQPATDDRPPADEMPVAAMRAATISTLDGTVITHGVAELHGTAEAWTATIARLDQPGNIATAYYAEHIRHVVLSLNDRRRARAQLVGTCFSTANERTCDLRGTEPLSHATPA